MTFKPEFSEEFNNFVSTIVDKISSFEGCSFVEILRDVTNENVFFTCSYWDNEQSLNNYRHSELFVEVWGKTKPMFAKKAEAWSTEIVAKSLK